MNNLLIYNHSESFIFLDIKKIIDLVMNFSISSLVIYLCVYLMIVHCVLLIYSKPVNKSIQISIKLST